VATRDTRIVIARPRIIDRLRASRRARLVTLVAPAGYAKTTTLRAWDAADPRAFTWVSCDRRHSDPSFFARSVARALSGVAPIDEQTVDALSVEAAWPRVALERLGSVLEDSDGSFVLAIDDGHRVAGSPASVELLEGLLDVLPPESQLVLGSREAPPFRLGRLRANAQLVEFSAADLAMTRGESRLVLAAGGLDLADEQFDLIHDRTEGWPAALHLATLALVGREEEDAVAEFAGDDRAVTEYLQDEFLASSTDDEVAFMTATSLLEVLNGPLCDTVLGRNDSDAMLDKLASSNALVVPLDRTGHSYRYHHLFAEMLQAELRRTRADAVSEIHASASRWFAGSGKTELAVEHAIASGDACLAGSLIWESLPEMTGRGQLVTLWRWLDAVGEQHFTKCHGLLFTAAHCSILSGPGDEAARWLTVAGSLPPRDGCPVDTEADLTMLRATLSKEGIGRMLEDSEQAIELFSPESVWRGAALFYRGVALHLLGDPDAAVPVLRESARRTASVSPIMQALSLAQLSLIACDQGDRDVALRYAAEARAQVDRCGLSEYPAMDLVYAAEAMTLALDGQTARALESRGKALRLLNLMNGFPLWYEVETRLALARASARLGDAGGAAEFVRQTRARLESLPDAVALGSWVESLEGSIGAGSSNGGSESPRLTRAELRTLRFLPTHLSFRQIGERNHVSANTVKTQARAIYSKLGASTRAEAVERARGLRLLDPDD
jgi:LuxR family maltose regulon positive regulatory protein